MLASPLTWGQSPVTALEVLQAILTAYYMITGRCLMKLKQHECFF